MTQEEKARAYDEVLNKIKPLYEQARKDGNPIWSTYEYFVPELAESEDERIRKGLVKLLTVAGESYVVDSTGIKKESYLAYLEKQKDLDKMIVVSPEVWDKAIADAYENGKKECEKQKEPHYTKRNALFDKCVENCDPAVMKKVSDEVNEMLEKEHKSTESELKIPDWVYGNWDDEYMINTVIGRYSLHAEVARKRGDTHDYSLSKSMEGWLRNVVKPLILKNQKEQKPTEWSEDSVKYKEGFKAGRESGLCDGQKYVLNNLDSYGLCKPAEWSEEDEKMLRTIISDGSRGVELDSKQISWLKSLRRFWNPSAQELGALKTAVSVLTEERTFPKAAEQIQKIIDVFDGKELRKDWKPSEEQMKALEDAFRKDGSDEYRKTINSRSMEPAKRTGTSWTDKS